MSLAHPPRLASAWRCLVAALALICVVSGAARAQGLKFPDLTARVVDQASILDAAARSRLETKLAAHEQKTSDQVVVATVPSLQGTSVEEFANQLFRHWKLGQAKTNNGVLVLVAPSERKMRIEVGYGLEGALTDAVAKMIVQAAMAPKFKAGDFAGGLDAGVDAIISTLLGDSEWQDRVKLRNPPEAENYDVLVIIFIVVMVIIILNMSNNGRGGGRAHRRRNGGWIVTTPSSGGWSGGSSWGGGSSSGGGFSGGGGSSGGGGASGDW